MNFTVDVQPDFIQRLASVSGKPLTGLLEGGRWPRSTSWARFRVFIVPGDEAPCRVTASPVRSNPVVTKDIDADPPVTPWSPPG